MQEQEENVTPTSEETNSNGMSYDDGVIKVNLSEFNKPAEEVAPPAETEDTDNQDPPSDQESEEQISVLQEITDEEEQIEEDVEELTDQVEQTTTEAPPSVELPENIQKVVEFMDETGGTLEDYVRLNTDYSNLSDEQLVREYYESTKPHLDKDDISLLMEDFKYDEDLDNERDIRKSKIAFKEEVAKAKNHLEGLKSKYYKEVKAGSRLTSDQQKAVDFFNRYNEENKENTQLADRQASVFKERTEKLFSNEFKGFDFKVGDKKFRFNVNNADKVKTEQSDINNFVKKFLNDKNEMSDAAGYHKSLFTAMNPDAIANHFYQQGKADAVKETMAKARNIDMNPRGAHEQVKASNGWTVRSISSGTSSSKLKIRK